MMDLGFVVDTSLRVRALMEEIGLKPWPKVTGGKGYHITAPLTERMTHDQAHRFAHELAQSVAGEDRRYTTSASMGRELATSSSIISGTAAVRPPSELGLREPAEAMSRPVSWEQLSRAIDPAAFTMAAPNSPPSGRAGGAKHVLPASRARAMRKRSRGDRP